MIRTLRKSAALALAGGLASLGLAGSAAAVDETGNMTAEILTALTLTESTALDFGKVIADGVGGTVGVAHTTSTVTCGGLLSCVGTAAAAVFDVTGSASETLDVTLPTTDQTVTSGLNTMTVNNFQSDAAGGTMTLDGTGNGTLNVGADLVVGASQAEGTYTGTYTASVNYQ